jgi:hypothetical protein
MSVKEVPTDQWFDLSERFVDSKIFGYVPRGVSPNEAPVCSRIQLNRTNKKVPQRWLSATVFAQREFYEASAICGIMEESEKTIASRGHHHLGVPQKL